MIPSDYMNLTNQVERHIPVDQWMIDGVHVWPLVRIILTTELHNQRAHAPAHSGFRTLQDKVLYAGRRLASYYRLMIADREHNEDPGAQAEIAVLAGSITRQLRTPWGWFATIPDALREELSTHSARMLFLETAGPVEYRTPRYSASMPVDLGLFYGLLRTKAHLALTSPSAQDVSHLLPGFSDFEQLLARESIHANSATPQRVLFVARLLGVYARFYRSILLRVKPKLGLVVAFYTMEGMAYCAACRQLGIPCFDIQHGVAGELHRGYGRWNRVPPTGFNVLPSGFWCWSQEDADAIQAWNRPLGEPHDVIIGGNIWADFWRRKRPSRVRQSYEGGIEELGERATDELRVLYTMQDTELPELLLRAIEGSPKHFRWLIRVHPNSIRHEARIAARFDHRSNVEVRVATRVPLHLLLQQVDVHVTRWSAVVHDASYYRVPSVVIDEIGADLFSSEIDAGRCKAKYDVAELLEAISKYGRRESPMNEPGNSEEGVRRLLDIVRQGEPEGKPTVP